MTDTSRYAHDDLAVAPATFDIATFLYIAGIEGSIAVSPISKFELSKILVMRSDAQPQGVSISSKDQNIAIPICSSGLKTFYSLLQSSYRPVSTQR
tara:strand:+ start:58 stop:345 length:288 start_codon:yes stop_codon:yes gene_type:complete